MKRGGPRVGQRRARKNSYCSARTLGGWLVEAVRAPDLHVPAVKSALFLRSSYVPGATAARAVLLTNPWWRLDLTATSLRTCRAFRCLYADYARGVPQRVDSFESSRVSGGGSCRLFCWHNMLLEGRKVRSCRPRGMRRLETALYHS